VGLPQCGSWTGRVGLPQCGSWTGRVGVLHSVGHELV